MYGDLSSHPLPPSSMTDLAYEKPLPEALTRAENLPSLPSVAVEVLRLTQDENSTLDHLAQALSRDPALSAKILKLSNSSLFGMGKEVTTLQRATMVLGMKTVKLMSLSFSLASTLPKSGPKARFDLAEYWRRSMIAAVSARSFAKLIGSREGDEAFLCGLLGHLGKLVLHQCLAEEYETVLQEAKGWPSLDVEEQCLGFTSADVCSTLLKTWELPALIYTAVGYMRRPEALPSGSSEATKRLVALMSVAALVERVLCDESKGPALAELRDAAGARHQLSPEQVDAFLIGLESGIRETAEMLAVELPTGLSHQELVDQARMQIVNVSLGTTMDLVKERRRTDELEVQNRELSSRANTDKLTGLPNRAAFDEFLGRHVNERLNGKVVRALGVVMVDVDKFKSFNDSHGHQAGDEVLRMIGALLARLTRKGDLPARYGGEEFAVVAPQTTPFGLKTIAERLREAIEQELVSFEGKELRVTASFGGACLSDVRAEGDGAALIKLADHHLYKAKESGRNRCEIYPRIQLPGR